jgi:hypothetical protein
MKIPENIDLGDPDDDDVRRLIDAWLEEHPMSAEDKAAYEEWERNEAAWFKTEQGKVEHIGENLAIYAGSLDSDKFNPLARQLLWSFRRAHGRDLESYLELETWYSKAGRA